MELLAALLLSRLVKKVTSTVQMTFSATVFWSDNQIVLAWLKRTPGTLEVFVRNRVVQINDITAGSTREKIRSDICQQKITNMGTTDMLIFVILFPFSWPAESRFREYILKSVNRVHANFFFIPTVRYVFESVNRNDDWNAQIRDFVLDIGNSVHS